MLKTSDKFEISCQNTTKTTKKLTPNLAVALSRALPPLQAIQKSEASFFFTGTFGRVLPNILGPQACKAADRSSHPIPMADAVRKLEVAGISAGIPVKSPQLVVHRSASALRQLLDAGVKADDPRCLALLQLVNSARLLLVPTPPAAAPQGGRLRDTMAIAVDIDVSTASMAAIMGLKNSSQLSGAAMAVVSAGASASKGRAEGQGSESGRRKIRLLPKPAKHAVQELMNLVRSDTDLGTRAKDEAVGRSNSMANKLHKLRAGQRHASVRKRKLLEMQPHLSESQIEQAMAALPPTNPSGPVLNFATNPSLGAAQPLPPTRARRLLHPNPVSVPLAVAARPSARATSMHYNALPPREFGPRPTMAVIASAATQNSAAAVVNTPPTHQAQPQQQQSQLYQQQQQQRQLLPAPPRHQQQPAAPSVAIAPAQTPVARHAYRPVGPMEDVVGTPADVMTAFMEPLDQVYGMPSEENCDAEQIRSVLAERERTVYRLMHRRQVEIANMPLGMSEDVRRKAIIESKQLKLIELQRVARYRVCAEMKKMWSSAVQEDGVVPTDHLSRLFRRRDPPIYSYTDGYPRITPFDGIPEMPTRPPEVVAYDSQRMAQFDRSRMLAQGKKIQSDFVNRLSVHASNFRNFFGYVEWTRTRIGKGVDRYFLDKARAEERRRKQERYERLRLLRSNNEQAYFDLLKSTKNERLLQLVRQTDFYLMQIGAQVEKTRDDHEPAAGLSQANAFSEELNDEAEVPLEAMRRRRDMYYTVTHAVNEEVYQPDIMVHGKLKPYQVEGLKWMISLYNNNLNGILADEMGLGKTIQTIALITYLVEAKKNPGPFLIIVPLSTLGNWVRELNLWAPSIVKVVYRGDKNKRRNIQLTQMAGTRYNVLLTTYEFVVRDQTVLSRVQWKYIVIDEGHRMKNANCKLAMTLGVKYKSRNRLLLTGTPLQNNLTELWALLNFLLPSIFNSADTFETWFKQPFETTTLGDTAELEEEETLLVINRLHQVLRPFLLRRLKTDVESQLPQKVEHVIRCDMSAWQRVLYRQVRARVGLATGAATGGTRSFNNLLMQCKKICNHPYLFYDDEAIIDLPQDALIRSSGKFFVLQHMLRKFKLRGHRTLIFSQMTSALDYLEDFLTAIGLQYLRLDGTTQADDRQDLLNMFNAEDSPYFCFLLSTRAGGLGLNLQTADTVIIFDSDWNPMMDLQAQDRAHRIGQTKVVSVYRLISSGTVEVKILEQANRKLEVDAQVIQAGQFNNKSTESDRNQMLKDILRQKTTEDDELGDVPDMEELNRMFARDEEEFDLFTKYDEESVAEDKHLTLMVDESEIPEWVLKPDIDHKTAEEQEAENLLSHGRGRRARKAVQDMDQLTELEWIRVMEGEITVEQAFEKRERRKASIKRRRSIANDSEDEEDEEEDDEDVEDDEEAKEGEVEDDIAKSDSPSANGDIADAEPRGRSKGGRRLSFSVATSVRGAGQRTTRDDTPNGAPSSRPVRVRRPSAVTKDSREGSVTPQPESRSRAGRLRRPSALATGCSELNGVRPNGTQAAENEDKASGPVSKAGGLTNGGSGDSSKRPRKRTRREEGLLSNSVREPGPGRHGHEMSLGSKTGDVNIEDVENSKHEAVAGGAQDRAVPRVKLVMSTSGGNAAGISVVANGTTTPSARVQGSTKRKRVVAAEKTDVADGERFNSRRGSNARSRASRTVSPVLDAKEDSARRTGNRNKRRRRSVAFSDQGKGEEKQANDKMLGGNDPGELSDDADEEESVAPRPSVVLKLRVRMRSRRAAGTRK